MGMLDEVKSKKKQKAAENWFKMAEGAKTPEKQIEYYTNSLDVNPYNAEAWFRKGRILEKTGDFEEAKRSFDLAIEVDPDYQGLIGKKQPELDNVASSSMDVTPEPVEETAFIDNPVKSSEDDQINEDLESTGDEGWVTESVREERTSFVSPEGEESIFSHLGSDDANSDEDVFTSSPSDVENESISSFGSMNARESAQDIVADTTIAEEEVDEREVVEKSPVFADTFSDNDEQEDENTFSAPANDTFSDNEFAKQPETQESAFRQTPSPEQDHSSAFDDSEAEKLASAASISAVNNTTSTGSSEQSDSMAVASTSASVTDAGQFTDVKVPTKEAIKFWAIGIVAMVIAFLIANLLTK